MNQPPHILLIDPAPGRENLAARISEKGCTCTVAVGIHDAMVQSLMRNPGLIVADLSTEGASGNECRARLGRIPHFDNALFITIGGDGDLPDTVDDETVAERVCALLKEDGGASHTPAPPAQEDARQTRPTVTEQAPMTANRLDETLARLAREQSSLTLEVKNDRQAFGEVMVQDGVAIHAVTDSGETGAPALADIHTWTITHIDYGPAPREETPVTLNVPPHGLQTDTPKDAPHAAAPRPPGGNRRLDGLLAELEAVGLIEKGTP